jgi:ATP-dependent DNA helicase RecG
MRTLRDLEELLDQLDQDIGAELEDQDLDFKEWDTTSMDKAVRKVIDWAICMANGGGGTVVFGVADNVEGRARAVRGVPPEVDINRLKLAVYDATDPKLTPVFEELRVPEGTGRLIVMQVYPGLPPYTDTKGRGTIRVGKDCKPLTGTLRRKIAVETGESDFTVVTLDMPLSELLSAAAMETLREIAARERAPSDLLDLSDEELLDGIGVLRQGKLTRAGLLLGGSPGAIREHLPAYAWTHLRMRSDTEYADRADGREALPVALLRVLDRIHADNPIQTVRQGLFHFEYRTYPEIALREALLNAFCHADYRVASPILVKQYADRIEITNPGGLIGGITPDNILHHTPATRNPCLVDALVRLRLINRSNLGIQRIYTALLIEGKEPPALADLGEAFRLVFRASKLSPAFRAFVAEENKRGVDLGVDTLLVLQHLLRHPEIDTATAAKNCQRHQGDAREVLSRMERQLGYLDRGGSGRGTYWTLRSEVHDRMAAPGDVDRDRRIDWEAAKTRVLSVIRQRHAHGEPPLVNADVRRLTNLDRKQVNRLIHELEDEGHVRMEGHGRGARYILASLMERNK